MQYISEDKFNEGIMIRAISLKTHEYDQQEGTGIAHAIYLIFWYIRFSGQNRKRGCFLMSGGKDCKVGERIRLKRKALGLSQEELAERMNVTAALISNYENDKVDIKSSVMRELASILGTSVAYLMDGDPDG